MTKIIPSALVALALLSGPASAAGCEREFDDISKAISGRLNMSDGHRAAMMRLALTGYDHCMSGDRSSAASIRKTLMKQLRQSLGEH